MSDRRFSVGPSAGPLLQTVPFFISCVTSTSTIITRRADEVVTFHGPLQSFLMHPCIFIWVCPCTRFSVSIKWKGQKMPISAQLDIVAMHWFITECVYVFPHRENISMHWTHERQPFFWKIFVSLDEITEWVKLVTEYSTAEFLSKLVIVSQRGKSRSPTLSCRHVK